ncbi:sulfur carrier protein ThiS, partial [Acinetobacter baumannii]
MKIYLNGQITPTDCKNLLELIQYLALENKRYAIEFNSRIIPKS